MEKITPVLSVYHWFTDTSLGNIYTIYTSVITVGTYVTNLLALFISIKKEYCLVFKKFRSYGLFWQTIITANF